MKSETSIRNLQNQAITLIKLKVTCIKPRNDVMYKFQVNIRIIQRYLLRAKI